MTEQFTTLVSTALPFNQNNIDTDQIIPARFLKGTQKTGLGKCLFNDWRYLPDGSNNPDFALNHPQYQGAQILVAPHNFGCGSSREHAPWALKDYGFKAILAISFADIFKNNSLKNQLLPIALPESVILGLLEQLPQQPELKITIDLPSQTVEIPGSGKHSFEINAFRKTCLLQGLDDIGYTFTHQAKIEAFEKAHGMASA